MDFYPGLHQLGDAQHFDLSCIHWGRLERRKKPVGGKVLVDSRAFMELALHGGYRHGVEAYAACLHRLWTEGVVDIIAAVAQDYMCEPFMLAKTGKTILEHQRLTIERYDALKAELERLFDGAVPFHLMPVLQGYSPADYVRHVEMYGARLTPGIWVGVGSVCKRQGDVRLIENVLLAIKEVRPDLRLHGFRREGHGVRQPNCRQTSTLRRLYGLELRRSKAGSQRQRLARGARVCGAHRLALCASRVSTEALLGARFQKVQRGKDD